MSGFGKPLDLHEYARRISDDLPAALGLPGTKRKVKAPVELPERPRLIGSDSEAECSSCTDLAVYPSVIWDVNGYYRELGFEFPYRPTKREIRRALFVVQWMQSARMTYYAKQLLADDVRRAYDRMPLGEPFFDDYYEEMFRNKAAVEVGRRVAEGLVDVEDGNARERVLSEWGLGFNDDLAEAEPAPEDDLVEISWKWSFYLWRSVCLNTERLAEWQAALVREFSSRGARIRFCVGYFGKSPLSWVSGVVGDRIVLYLNEDAAVADIDIATVAMTVLSDHGVVKQLPEGNARKEICP